MPGAMSCPDRHFTRCPPGYEPWRIAISDEDTGTGPERGLVERRFANSRRICFGRTSMAQDYRPGEIVPQFGVYRSLPPAPDPSLLAA
jgi:hypothetical protein